MLDARSASSRITVNGSRSPTGTSGTLGEEIGEPHDRGERVVQVVRDPRDELPDRRHLLRLDQLVLQPAPLGAVVEEEHDAGPVAAGESAPTTRHRRRRPGAELDFAARPLVRRSRSRSGRHSGGRKARPGRPTRPRARFRPGRKRPDWHGVCCHLRSTMQSAGAMASTTSCQERRPSSCKYRPSGRFPARCRPAPPRPSSSARSRGP